MEGKQCSKCHDVKPRDRFFRNRTTKDGLTSQCKPCHGDTVRTSIAKRKAERAAQGL